MRQRVPSNSPIWRSDFAPSVPPAVRGLHFVPLGPSVVEADYAAIMSCRDRLRRELDWNGWPADDFTLADNVADLSEHYAEYLQRVAYAWSVFSGDRCVGCVYLEPWSTGAQLAFWMVDDARAHEQPVVEHLVDWLASWPIERVVVPVRPQNAHALAWLREGSWVSVGGPDGHLSFGRAT